MKKIQICIWLLLLASVTYSQNKIKIDSLEKELKKYETERTELSGKIPEQRDTILANIYYSLSTQYWGSDPDKSLEYAKLSLNHADRLNYKKGIAQGLYSISISYRNKAEYNKALTYGQNALDNYKEIKYNKGIAMTHEQMGLIYMILSKGPEAMDHMLNSLRIREQIGDSAGMAGTYNNLGTLYHDQNNNAEAVKNYLAALELLKIKSNKRLEAAILINLGNIRETEEKLDEALKYLTQGLAIAQSIGHREYEGNALEIIGSIYLKKGQYSKSGEHYEMALKIREEMDDKDGIASALGNLSNLRLKEGRLKDALNYSDIAIAVGEKIGALHHMKYAYEVRIQIDSSMKNFNAVLNDYKMYNLIKDSIFNIDKNKKITELQMQYVFEKQQSADSLKHANELKIQTLSLEKQKTFTFMGLATTILAIMLLFFVYRNFRNQQLANKKIKETQEQLIRSEKMAAFGLIASRMAHEIQNPLNFVNNFSEMSEEMIKEIIDSLKDDNKTTANIILQNLQKINHHGKRADSIIKKLLEHTRTGTAHEFFETT